MKVKFVSAFLIIAILLPGLSIGGRTSGTAFAASLDESQFSSKQFLSYPIKSNAPLSVGGPIGQNSGSWTLTFNDEFSGTSLDRTKWRSDYVNGVNGELQEYVDDDSHNNYLESNGILSLVARKENYQGKSYTSGVITTQDRFYQKYGYLEIRAKMPPNAMGLWPGFWTLPNPSGWPPEIDTIEWLGRQPTVAYMNVHSANPIAESLGWYNSSDWSSDYHTYGTEWRSDAIIWYIDGVERKRFTDATKIPSVAMFLVANLAVGGTWPHSPDSTTVFPAYFNIDYIRVWKPVDTQPSVTTNSSFEQTGLSPWYSPWSIRNDLGASFMQDGTTAASGTNSFKATLSSANSTQPWVVALMQKNLSLTSGQSYTLSFYAKASAARSIQAVIQNQNSPYTEYLIKTTGITTSWSKYSYGFTMPTSISSGMININLASQTGTVWLDQILLCKGTTGCYETN